MRVAFDRLVKPDGTIQVPPTFAGQVVTIVTGDVDDLHRPAACWSCGTTDMVPVAPGARNFVHLPGCKR